MDTKTPVKLEPYTRTPHNPYDREYIVRVTQPRTDISYLDSIYKDATGNSRLDDLNKEANQKKSKGPLQIETFVYQFGVTLYDFFTQGFYMFSDNSDLSEDSKQIYLGIFFLILSFIFLLISY